MNQCISEMNSPQIKPCNDIHTNQTENEQTTITKDTKVQNPTEIPQSVQKISNNKRDNDKKPFSSQKKQQKGKKISGGDQSAFPKSVEKIMIHHNAKDKNSHSSQKNTKDKVATVTNIEKPQSTDEQQTNPEEDILFSKNKKAFLNILKALFIIEQIIDVIEADNLLDYKKEAYVEFLFLVSTRVCNYLNSAKTMLDKQNTSQEMQNLRDNIDAYLDKSNSKIRVYNMWIGQMRKKLQNKISKILNMSRSVVGKELFLDGCQGDDYTEKEQIEFTHCNYIQKVLNSKQIKAQHFKNHRFKRVLKGYRECCELKQDGFNNQNEIKSKMEKILLEH